MYKANKQVFDQLSYRFKQECTMFTLTNLKVLQNDAPGINNMEQGDAVML